MGPGSTIAGLEPAAFVVGKNVILSSSLISIVLLPCTGQTGDAGNDKLQHKIKLFNTEELEPIEEPPPETDL